MKEITPYKTLEGAKRALDNGGRFFNLFTKAGDGKITQSEISKAAGVLGDKNSVMLFFQLAISRLTNAEQQSLMDHLEEKIKTQWRESPVETIPVYRFHQTATPRKPVIIEGYPFFLEDREQFNSFIMVPISTGNTTTMMMIPIYDHYDIYEVYGNSDKTGRSALIGITRRKGRHQLAATWTTFAGVVKEMEFKKKKRKKPFVEATFMVK